MARYGSFKYSEQKYGASPATDLFLWSFIVDWDRDGYYTGENEALRMADLSIIRGRDSLVERNGGGFARFRPGTAIALLNNSDGRYDPFNINSPLFPHVTPGKHVRIAVKNGNTGANYELMRGRIADIQPYNRGNVRMARIYVVDGLQFLSDRTIRIGTRQQGSAVIVDNRWSTGRWVDYILEMAAWPEDEWPRTYDLTGDHNDDTFKTLGFAWFWQRNTADAIRELEAAEGIGNFFHDREGNARFVGRKFTYDTILEIDESQLLTDITTPQPWETLRNRIEVEVNPIALHDLDAILWELDDVPFVVAEGSFTIDVAFRYEHFSVALANSGWIFTVNSAADGSGTNLTSQCSLQLSEAGDGTTIILLNNSVTDGYITSLSVTGDALYAAYKHVAHAENEDSIEIFDTRTFKISSPWLQESDFGQEVADYLVAHMGNAMMHPNVKLQNRPTLQFPVDLYVTQIHLTSPTMGLNRNYRAGKIEHKWLNANGQSVETALRLEPYFTPVDAESLGIDFVLQNDFSQNESFLYDQTDCSGPPPAGMMEWCLGDEWEGENTLHVALNQNDFEECYTDAESHVIQPGEVLYYEYRYQDSDTHPFLPSVFLDIYTVEGGFVYQEGVPFEIVSGLGDWRPYYLDLTPWGGQTISKISFTTGAAPVGSAVIYIDNVGIGVLLDA